MGRIVRNYIYNMLYQLFILIVPLITIPYLARILGSEKLGVFSYVRTVTVMITTLSLIGIYDYGNRQIAYLRDNKVEMSKIFFEIIILRIILTIIASFIYFFVANRSDYSIYFYAYYPLLLSSGLDVSWIFVAIEKMGVVVLKNFVSKLITVILIFIIIKTEEDLWKYILIISLSNIITNLSVYCQLKKIIVKVKINISNSYMHFIESIKLFSPQISLLICLQVDKLMIKNMTGLISQVGYYDQAQKIIQIPIGFIMVLSTIMMPRIANEYRNHNHKKIQEYIVIIGKVSLLLSIPMTVGMIVISFKFILWYLGNDFKDTIGILIVLSPVIVIKALEGISGKQFFVATNQIRILNKSYMIAAGVNVFLNWVLIKRYGSIGAAIATIVSSLVSLIVQYYYLCKQVEIKILIKEGLRYFNYSICMGIIVFIVSFRMPSTALATVFQIITGMVIYLSFLFIKKDKLILEVFKKLKKQLF